MIKIITGLPGSGKTFFAIHHLLQKHYQFLDGQWFKKEKVTIITDIEDLKLEHINLRDAIQKSGLKVEKFFTVDYQKKIIEKYGYVIYVIDEAQRVFHRKFYDKDTFYFFDFHRHLGIDIYLIVQNFYKLPLEIRSLAETEIRAVRKSLSLLGEFKYSSRIDDDILERMVLKPDKSIFDLYTSYKAESREVSKSRFKLMTVLAILCVPVGLYFFFNWYGSKKNKTVEKVQVENIKKPSTIVEGIEKKVEPEWITVSGWAGSEIDGNLIIEAYEYDGNVYRVGMHPMRKLGRVVQIMVSEDVAKAPQGQAVDEAGALPRAQAGMSQGPKGAIEKEVLGRSEIIKKERRFKRVTMGKGEKEGEKDKS